MRTKAISLATLLGLMLSTSFLVRLIIFMIFSQLLSEDEDFSCLLQQLDNVQTVLLDNSLINVQLDSVVVMFFILMQS